MPSRMQFSANLGFLWTDRSLPEAIFAAAKAGFDAVECHWPYDTPSDAVLTALTATGLPMLSLNTVKGDRPGDFGLAAVPGRQAAARAAIDQAIAYAEAVNAHAIHILAGKAVGSEAQTVFLDNLRYAATRTDRRILIEPMNAIDVPGYLVRDLTTARELLTRAGVPNLKLMFDCYHVGRTEGDVLTALRQHLPLIGHIQCAAVPDRGPPDHGNVDYGRVFAALRSAGWDLPIGAEYQPLGATEASLGWLHAQKSV